MPVRDGGATLPAAVKSVLAQARAVDEIVVAVGPSRDDSRAVADRLARRDARVRVVDNPSGRTSDALNAAIAAARGEVLVRVDAQAVLPSDYVGVALRALERTGAANVGGRQVPVAERGFARAVAAAMRSPLGTGGAAYRNATTAGPVDTVYLGVFRRAALDAVGGFDPAFARNQDAELNQRLRDAGYTVWLEPTLAVSYRPRGTVRSLASQYLQYGRWRRLTARSHPGSLRARQLAPPLLVAGLAVAATTTAVTGRPRALLVASAGYGALVTVGGQLAASRAGDGPPTALALATMHLSWGVGFLLGPPRTPRRASPHAAVPDD